MKENDYYGHYKAFVKELSRKPDQTLQVYCQENGVVWRRLYDWMRRHHISLKRLYQTYRPESNGNATATCIQGDVDFRELIPVKSMAGGTALPEDISSINGVCVNLPSGITVSLGECSVTVLSQLIAGLAGKEVPCVLS